MRYFTWILELVSYILWIILATITIFSYLSLSTSSIFWKKKRLQKLIFNRILAISGTSLFGTQPLNFPKTPLKNLILPCLEKSLSRITGKKDLKPFFLSLSHVIWVQKCYLVKIFEKTTHLAPFSAAYFFLIYFLKILQFNFSWSQPGPLNTLRNWGHGIEYPSMTWWSNVHKSLIFHPKLHKKVTNKYHKSLGKKY